MFEPGMLQTVVANLTAGGAGLLTGVQARWLGCAPSDKPRIYYANHTSHMDFVLLWSALPEHFRKKTRPVAASDYWSQNAVRRYFIQRVFHGVLVDRGHFVRGRHPLEALIQALDAGQSLIIFPEGTRGTGEVLQPFKCGLFHLAQARPQVELAPVWMENVCRVMPKGAPLPIPLLCSVTFGRPAVLEPNEFKEVFLARLRSNLLELSTR
ncbi:MAG TPA: lysophospholipid acyltransferase family protein [Bryobacteraceae bacterium]|jgi:1-acyl-sn-glycerol-3-phosphate acyltransferase|nr:lysophospholipid acyltransferase family protein [Bryobacteraceae bacterium]